MSTERTGWRDQRISKRHQQWGVGCPAIDLDFVMVEYNHSKPVALIEYKHERARPQVFTHPNYKALINLGDRAELPVFVVRYNNDFSAFRMFALNGIAKYHLNEKSGFNEYEYVKFLYKLRGSTLTEQAWTTMHQTSPLIY